MSWLLKCTVVAQQNRVTPSPFNFGLETLDLALGLRQINSQQIFTSILDWRGGQDEFDEWWSGERYQTRLSVSSTFKTD